MHSLMNTSCSSKDIPPPDPSLPSPQFPKGRKWQDTQCLIVSSWLQVVLFKWRWKIIEKIPFHGMENVSQIEKSINNFTWTVWSGLFWEDTSRMSNCEAWTYVLMPNCQVESCFFVQIAVVGYFESLHYKVKYPTQKNNKLWNMLYNCSANRVSQSWNYGQNRAMHKTGIQYADKLTIMKFWITHGQN